MLLALLYFVPIVSRGGVVSLLTRWLTWHVNELPRCHITTLSSCHVTRCFWLQFEVLRSKICHVICALCAVRRCRAELLCGCSCCSCWGIHRRPPAGVVNTFKLTR